MSKEAQKYYAQTVFMEKSENSLHWHILGPPGAGVSTLGRALAQALDAVYIDVDDIVWFTDDALPYRRKRNTDHRRALLTEKLQAAPRWVLGGALCGWGDVFLPQFDRIIFLDQHTEIRLAQIRQREIARYGPERLAPGGDLNTVFEKFLQWATAYDDSTTQRGRAAEMEWLAASGKPVMFISEQSAVSSYQGVHASLSLLMNHFFRDDINA